MQLRIENAYYQDGLPKRGLDGFLGTQVAHYQVRTKGLRLLSVESLIKQLPREQAPVQHLIPASQTRFARYRYYYAVVFSHRGNLRGSVLLGASSIAELDRLSAALVTDPESVCGNPSPHCSVFPEACSVSIDVEIVVNGVPQIVTSGTLLASLVPAARHVEILRREGDRSAASIKIEPHDPTELRVPLMAGDRVTWN